MNAPTTAAARHLAAPQPRLNFQAVAPELYQAQAGINAMLRQSSLGLGLLELVFLRASQINGCAFCVDMHVRELLALGEDLQRINSVITWPEADFYDDRERAALNWAERCTRLSQAHPGQQDFDALRPHFSDREIVELTYAIGSINVWNRLCAGFAAPVARKPITL
ncbi:carboxymuconolactone decarboxylase family protein [Delftia sp. PS-11]|uniref:carboxymuconolactone decarboxylase family protein n=1 Tax=Delftia sp. PS-11 TaxID=2767222 RepID=UPI002458A3F6|nr:carboxymuconolactone decarboxylase family protein [Delftia sp. PS-11]KAJ8742614.1 carboxymuconolactone decarboxylase family protein [Delftia sp. PS-11]